MSSSSSHAVLIILPSTWLPFCVAACVREFPSCDFFYFLFHTSINIQCHSLHYREFVDLAENLISFEGSYAISLFHLNMALKQTESPFVERLCCSQPPLQCVP